MSSFLIMNCGIRTNREWNYKHVAVPTFISAQLSPSVFYLIFILLKLILFYSILFYFISWCFFEYLLPIHSHLYLNWKLPFQKVLQVDRQTDSNCYRAAPQLKGNCSENPLKWSPPCQFVLVNFLGTPGLLSAPSRL